MLPRINVPLLLAIDVQWIAESKQLATKTTAVHNQDQNRQNHSEKTNRAYLKDEPSITSHISGLCCRTICPPVDTACVDICM